MKTPTCRKIVVAYREAIERGFPMREPYVLISIHDPDKRPVRVRYNNLCKAVLELAFHDVEPTPGFVPSRQIAYMCNDDAKSIWRFVREHAGCYEAIVVHCEQGMSRSPAVAAALAERLGLDASRFWQEYQPNEYGYDQCLKDHSNPEELPCRLRRTHRLKAGVVAC